MSQNSSRPPNRRPGLVAPIVIAVVAALIVLGALLSGRDRQPPAPPPAEPAAAPPPDPVLGRDDLIRDATAAAAAFAEVGNAPPKGRDPLAGRRFHLRIPFGCEGPRAVGNTAQAYYELDPEGRRARLVARPVTWSDSPVVQSLADSDVEAVEGFWLPQPWRLSDTCPRRQGTAAPALPASATPQTLGIAEVFRAGDSRVGRRGERPYEDVIKLAPDEELPIGAGFRLVLDGRFSTFPSGRVVRCSAESIEHRPVCLYAVVLDRVAFERGDNGEPLAEWLK